MAKLFGAQRMVLRAILDLPKDASGFVTDRQISHDTRIALKEVKDWIETLDGEELVEVARTTEGLAASITAKGRIQLGLFEPIPTTHDQIAASEVTQTLQPAPSTTSPASVDGTEIRPASTPTVQTPSEPIPRVSPGTGSSQTEAVDAFQVVLLIHGIRTQADWGPMVRSKLEVPGQIEVIPIKYGYFDAFRFWFPFWTRYKPMERVYVQIRVALLKYRRAYPNAKLSIIAQSFGTYVVGEIMKRDFKLQIHRLILCGSVLPRDFPWHQIPGRYDEKVVNECGKSDIWPVLAQSCSWGYGASGTHGFGVVLVKDRFHEGGHGQYFKPEFVEKYWEPFIRRGVYKGTEFETKMPPTPWWISVMGVLPLQWVTSLILMSLTLLIVTGIVTSMYHTIRARIDQFTDRESISPADEEVPPKIEQQPQGKKLHNGESLLFSQIDLSPLVKPPPTIAHDSIYPMLQCIRGDLLTPKGPLSPSLAQKVNRERELNGQPSQHIPRTVFASEIIEKRMLFSRSQLMTYFHADCFIEVIRVSPDGPKVIWKSSDSDGFAHNGSYIISPTIAEQQEQQSRFLLIVFVFPLDQSASNTLQNHTPPFQVLFSQSGGYP
jgi:hypothetical protein